ncbi:MAG: DoxX family membrane protein [Flavobacteriaceae bacterium]|nr:DoxX family membrane protein [Flavobacteriaceae bacterium]
MNSKVTMALRIILGLILIIFGANKFIGFMPSPELPEAAGNFMGALASTGYMFPLIGAVEVIVGLLLIINKWVPFALVLLAPVAVNMVLFHLKLAPAGMGPAALVTILNGILIYANWDKYRALFT